MSAADRIRARILEPGFLARAAALRQATIAQHGAAELRRRILEEAATWAGTPFHDCAGVKGAGCDCLHLIVRVYQAVGLLPADFAPGPYPPEWFQHRDEPLYLLGVAAHAQRVEVPQPGDFALYSFGRHAAHAAIIVDEHTLIHAYKPAGRVTRGSRGEILPRLDSYWSVLA